MRVGLELDTRVGTAAEPMDASCDIDPRTRVPGWRLVTRQLGEGG